ncbi:MAG TPA: RraA family protein [Casimicrobiaceae bacterium]
MKYLKYDEKLSQCFSGVIMDTLDSLGRRVQCMDPAVRPLTPMMRTWGEAVTARFVAVREIPKAPYGLEIKIVDDLREGQILVSQCDAEKLSAAWGGLLTTAARSRKARGVVTDGGARDYVEIVELGFPTFCRGLTPYDSLGRMDVVETNVGIHCGGIAVHPGDLIFADVDGTVVVPREMAEEVINKAWEKVNGESKVRDALRAGASVAETFGKYGIL